MHPAATMVATPLQQEWVPRSQILTPIPVTESSCLRINFAIFRIPIILVTTLKKQRIVQCYLRIGKLVPGHAQQRKKVWIFRVGIYMPGTYRLLPILMPFGLCKPKKLNSHIQKLYDLLYNQHISQLSLSSIYPII